MCPAHIHLQHDALRDQVSAVCGSLVLEFPEHRPRDRNQLEMVTFDECRISRLQAGAHRMRAPRHRFQDSQQISVKLLFQISGTQRLLTTRGAHLLRPGDWAMFDPVTEYQTECDAPISQFLLELPRDGLRPQLLARLNEPRIFSHSALCGPMVLLLREALKKRTASADPLLPEIGATVLAMSQPFQRLIDRRFGLAESPEQTLRDRCRAYIERRLHDPALSIEEIAQKMGCSRRRLFSVFEAQETSPAQLIRDLRMDRAETALAAPESIRVPISEIAFSCGFQSAAHFSRVIKARFGYPPAELRQRRSEARRAVA